MGYYVQTPENHFKAEQIVRIHGGQIVPQPASFADIPAGKSLIVVVENGIFDAAAYAFSEAEFETFTRPDDLRPRQFVLLDTALTHKLTGYKDID